MIDEVLEFHITTIAQHSFELGVLSTPSKIVGGTGAPPLPPPMQSHYFNNLCILFNYT